MGSKQTIFLGLDPAPEQVRRTTFLVRLCPRIESEIILKYTYSNTVTV